ncbi:MAG: AAA family ATPase [Candidatus Hadarchaeales archaeon]
MHDLLTRENPRNVLFFACDMLRSPEQILQVIKTFDLLAGTGRKYVFLDEVTWVEGRERAIKFILDSPLSRDKVLKVSGSSSLGLKKERFPGRPIKSSFRWASGSSATFLGAGSSGRNSAL